MWSLKREDPTFSRLPQENWRPRLLHCSPAKFLEQTLPAWPYPLNRRLLVICPSPVELQGHGPRLDDQHPTGLSTSHLSEPEHLSPPQSSQQSESRSNSHRGSQQARLRSESRPRGYQTPRQARHLASCWHWSWQSCNTPISARREMLAITTWD